MVFGGGGNDWIRTGVGDDIVEGDWPEVTLLGPADGIRSELQNLVGSWGPDEDDVVPYFKISGHLDAPSRAPA